MTIVLEQHETLKTGVFEIRQTVAIYISAEDAQRKVNRWVLDEISCVMGAEEPTLVVGQRAVWHVPVILTAPHIGHVGTAGIVEVDAGTGEMDDSPECKTAILEGAQKLADVMEPYAPRANEDISVEYIATDRDTALMEPQGNPVDIIDAVRQSQSAA